MVSRNAVKVNVENERFTVVCSRCPTLKISCCHLADYVPHVQHDYFSIFRQSNHCFLASSLPLLSSLRKLPIIKN